MVKTGVFKMRQWAQGPQVEEIHSGPGMSQRGYSRHLHRRKDLWVWSRSSSGNGEKDNFRKRKSSSKHGEVSGIWQTPRGIGATWESANHLVWPETGVLGKGVMRGRLRGRPKKT